MPFRLKDTQLQKDLDFISDGAFTKALNKRQNKPKKTTLIRIRFGERIGGEGSPKAFCAYFYGNEVVWINSPKQQL